MTAGEKRTFEKGESAFQTVLIVLRLPLTLAGSGKKGVLCMCVFQTVGCQSVKAREHHTPPLAVPACLHACLSP